MNKQFIFYGTTIAFLIGSLAACVPARKFNDLQAKQKKCEETTELLNKKLDSLANESENTSKKLADYKKRYDLLVRDTAVLGTSLRQMTTNYDKLSETYQKLLDKNKEMLAGNAEETKKLLTQLQTTQTELNKKEENLKKLERELNAKKQSLEELTTQLNAKQKRVTELENVLNAKDSVVRSLKTKVADALLGFEKSGLTVQNKNGKVYVSLEEKLLFKSGSTVVDPKGQEALKKLAKVLEIEKDINVLIEGHTDNVPFNGRGEIKDNWDLSVMRATSVVRIMLENSNIDPSRLLAAGRGEYLPVMENTTSQGRAKNRRIEIILTPKLDQLLQILENN